MSAVYDEALRPVGVNVAQFALLRNLSATEPKSIQELASSVDLERSTAARNVRVLERRGLVELGGSQADRRAAEIRLSADGVATLDRGAPLWEGAQARIEEDLGSPEAASLRQTLHALCAS